MSSLSLILQDLYRAEVDEMGFYIETSFPLGCAIHQMRYDFIKSGPLTKMMGLLSIVIIQDMPVIEEPIMIRDSKNELTRSRSNYSATNFRTLDGLPSVKPICSTPY